ncbi:metal-dependent hydrolase [Halorhabdus sp. CUG00001]|uniref:metal-dependent hydrolase n=1 Tax=Halorhabdus sp. CUG00001 TaxID=2600297 RepID=UPI00131DAE3E|nr:metal-dependent hydrolase [Halorhabdus sp. CUG00001]
MMLPTHALWGMVLALPVVWTAPEYAGIGLLAGFLGGVFPDLDMYVGHRKTLHYPVVYTGLAVPAVAVGIFVPSTLTIALAVGVTGAALHSRSDVYGGGLELRPWEGTSDRAVYDHYRGRWIGPRRWIGYDGSPSDLALSAVSAVPLLVITDGWLEVLVIASLGIAVVYTAVRRHLPSIGLVVLTDLAERVPGPVVDRLPDRYRDGIDGELQATTDGNA